MAEKRMGISKREADNIEMLISKDRRPELFLLAKKSKKPEILRILSEQEDLAIKVAVAKNKATPGQVRLDFINEKALYIIDVILKLYEKEPGIIVQEDIEALQILAKREDSPTIQKKAIKILKRLEIS